MRQRGRDAVWLLMRAGLRVRFAEMCLEVDGLRRRRESGILMCFLRTGNDVDVNALWV